MKVVSIVAEKPDVARKIAAAINCEDKKPGYIEGIYEDTKYYITYMFGHMYQLYDFKDYNSEMAKWDLKHFPFIPEEFKYKVKDNDGIKKQVKIIKGLIDKSDIVYCATDADMEGQLLWAEIADNLRIEKPVKKLWITSHTPKDVKSGLNNLIDDPKNLAAAGYCRQKLDQLIGLNFTTIYTLKSSGDATLKVGRVMLATLKLIFDREVELTGFKSSTFYTLKLTFMKEDQEYTGIYIDSTGKSKISSKDILQSIKNSVENNAGVINDKKVKQSNENAPKLFNLSDLQGHITEKYPEFTSEIVLEIMQSLYLKGHLTYPRTASRYLDNSQVDRVKDSLYAVLDLNIPELKTINRDDVKFHTNETLFDSSKVDSHPAIIPTDAVPNIEELSENERIVYLEVCKRFLSHFLPACEYETIEIETKVSDHLFRTREKRILSMGWRILLIDPETKIENDLNSLLQDINIEDEIIATEGEIKENITKAPARYTEKTLLTAMENCGKKVEDEEQMLKGFTIGTPATRGETIKKLIQCEYISKKGKHIILTELGAKVIHFFPVKKVLDVNFTGTIQKTLKDIENGDYDPEEFMSKMKSYVIKSSERIIRADIPQINKPQNIIGICPGCGANVIETEKCYACVNSLAKENTCNYKMWKENNFFKKIDIEFTEKIARGIVSGGALIKGIKSKKKDVKPYSATVTMVKDDNGWKYEFNFNTKKGTKKEKPKTTLKFKSKYN